MEVKNNPVNWFEIAVTDLDRAKKFYGAVFSNRIPRLGYGANQDGHVRLEP